MWYIPKKFLCRFPLSLGALVVSGVMLVILIIFAIATMIQAIYIQNCDSCSSYTWRTCYAYSITGFIYVIIMIIANFGFFWGYNKNKSSVVLSWIVVSSMWLALVFCLLIVLICVNYSQSGNLAGWLCALIFGLIAIAILLYGLMVMVAFWLELKLSKAPAPVSP